jgi:hypothetical protein
MDPVLLGKGFSKSIKFSEEYKYKSKPIKGSAK